jgi:hypothetical protein
MKPNVNDRVEFVGVMRECGDRSDFSSSTSSLSRVSHLGPIVGRGAATSPSTSRKRGSTARTTMLRIDTSLRAAI